MANFVGINFIGSKINFDIKGIDLSRQQSLNRQIQHIHQNIKDLFESPDDPTKFQIIYDISSAPTFLDQIIIKNIIQRFDSNQ